MRGEDYSHWHMVTTFCHSKQELLPGFEPGSVDSKSTVLTITPQERLTVRQPLTSSGIESRRGNQPKVVPMGIEPMTLGLLDQCSTI